MKADTTPLHLLFKKEIQYVVPLYQRPYVWREETHWAPLWEDLLGVVRQVERREMGGAADIAPHFLGAVVLEEQTGPVVSVERRYVIDGQQRLTTLQLLLAAGAMVAEAAGLQKPARQLRGLVENDSDYVVDEDDVFKIWPTNMDRSAFRSVMLQSQDWEIDDPFNLIHEAFAYFRGAFEQETAGLSDDDSAAWLSNFTQAVRNYIQLVVIDLEERDNPQVIFETLNARGTPLLAIDLVKNLLFLRAQRAGENVETLYKDHWRHLERAHWREELRQGRLIRPRAEIFLMHWLTMKRRDEVLSHQLYNTFRAYAESSPESPVQMVAELADDSKIFESFDEYAHGTPEHRFFRTLGILDTSTVLPLVLAMFKFELSVERLRVGLAALESWLVRRMLCGLTPKNYNRFVLELLNLIVKEPSNAGSLIIDRLTSADAETNVWPRDNDVESALLQQRFYGRLSQPRQRFILTAVERALRTKKTEDLELPPNLTVEHLMPQSWGTNWPLPDPDDFVATAERDARVQRIGNLTLVTGSLNAAASNYAWEDKRKELEKHSILRLNTEILSNHPIRWTDEDIDQRSGEIADVLCNVWPGPEREWTVDARREQVLITTSDSSEESLLPEDLIEQQGQRDRVPLMLQFLEEVSYWDGVRMRIGKAKEDKWRRVFFNRKGSPYGAFCRIHPPKGVARFRLDLADIPFAKDAEGLPVEDPYRVRIFLDSQEHLSEALALARRAWDNAIPDDDVT